MLGCSRSGQLGRSSSRSVSSKGPFCCYEGPQKGLCPLALHAWIFFFAACFRWETWAVMKALSAGNCSGCRQNKINGVRSWKKPGSVKPSPSKGQVCCSTCWLNVRLKWGHIHHSRGSFIFLVAVLILFCRSNKTLVAAWHGRAGRAGSAGESRSPW